MKHVEVLADTIGVRREGTDAERRAGAYIARQLAAFGYRVRYQTVALPNGTETRNVYAVKKGQTTKQFILGAHYDSKRPAPGANDNGSGVGTVLELASVLHETTTQPTVVLVFFCGEEGGHFGSDRYVGHLKRSQKAVIARMVSIDMVGYGARFHRRTMGRGPQDLSNLLRSFATRQEIAMTYLWDRNGVSDHEAFELAGIPSAWVEWRTDPAYHTRYDTAARIKPSRLNSAGELLRRLMVRLSRANLDALTAANKN